MSDRPLNERLYRDYIAPFVRETSRLGRKYLGPHAMGALDRLGSAAEAASPIASYDSSREAAGSALRAAREGRYGLAGTESVRSVGDAFMTLPGAAQAAPFLKAAGAFIALPGARRLAEAKMRAPGAWGGTDQLAKAQEAIKKGMSEAEAWERFGWSSPEVFAGRSTPVPIESRWFTAVPTDEAHLIGWPWSRGEAKAPLDRILGGVDQVYTAIPRLRGAPTTVSIDPDFITGLTTPATKFRTRVSGVTYPKFGIAPWDKPPDWRSMKDQQRLKWESQNGVLPQHYVEGIEAYARTPDEALRFLRHEALGHGAQVYQSVPGIDKAALGKSPSGGVPSVQVMSEDIEAMKKVYDSRFVTADERLSPEAREMMFMIRQREHALSKAPEHAQYLDTPHERAARIVTHLGPRSEAELKTLWPGAIDPYAKGMEAPFIYDGPKGFAGVPFDAYRIEPDVGSYLSAVDRLRRREMMRAARARLREREAVAPMSPAAQLADE